MGCSSLTSVTMPGSVTSIGNEAFSGCTNLLTVKSYIEEPFNVSRFSEPTYRQGTLYVPKGTKELYIRFDGWREFLRIEEMEEGAEPAPNGECAMPTIIIIGNTIRFECATPEAEFTSTLIAEEKFTGSKIDLSENDVTYTLTVYATAPGYDRSQPAKAIIVAKKGDMNGDGTVGIGDIVAITNIMAGN